MKGNPELTSRRIKPLYFLVGEEDFQKNQFLDEIKKAFFPDRAGWVNYEYLLGEETTPALILDAVRTPAWDLFAAASSPDARQRRLVVVAEAEKIQPSSWRAMDDYFSRPSPEACLVFLIRRRPRKWTRPESTPPGSVKAFYPLKGERLREWVKEEARKRGLNLTAPVREELLSLAGEDLYALSGELDKLLLYQESGGRITPREIRALTGSSRSANLFDLSKFIVSGETDRALACLNLLLEEGEAPLKILNRLEEDLRRLWLGREIWETTGNPAEVFRASGVRFYQKEFLEQIKKFRLDSFPARYQCLLDTNLKIKESGGSPRIALERLVINLNQLGNAGVQDRD